MTQIRGKLLASVAGLVASDLQRRGVCRRSVADRLDRLGLRPEARRRAGVGQEGRLDDHDERLYRPERRLFLPAAGRRQISRMGAGPELRDRKGRCRSRRNQAPGFQARRHRPTRRSAIRQLPPEMMVAALPDATPERCQHQEDLHQRVHRLPHPGLSAAIQVRRSRLEQDHQSDEGGSRLRRLSRRQCQGQPDHRIQPQGSRGLSGARARPRRNLDEVQGPSASDRRSRPRRVDDL